jgi:hypothetical protein
LGDKTVQVGGAKTGSGGHTVMLFCQGIRQEYATSSRLSNWNSLCFFSDWKVTADFTNVFRTARGRGFGLGDGSSKEIRIPRTVRKKITKIVVAVIVNRLCLMPWPYSIFNQFPQSRMKRSNFV